MPAIKSILEPFTSEERYDMSLQEQHDAEWQIERLLAKAGVIARGYKLRYHDLVSAKVVSYSVIIGTWKDARHPPFVRVFTETGMFEFDLNDVFNVFIIQE